MSGEIAGCLMFLALAAQAQTLPLEIKQDLTKYNQSSERGLPISDDDTDFGSDGRGPALDQTLGAPGAHQLRTAVTFSHVLPRTNVTDSVPYPYPNDTHTNSIPTTPTIVLTRASIGAPYISREVSFLLGSVISPPDEDENGDPLADGTDPEDYWFTEPDDSDNPNNKYYYSPHAGRVFASESGNVIITWIKREPEAETPSDASDTSKWLNSGTAYFRKYEKSYIVSGSTVKSPQNLYWNVEPFTGPAVDLPITQVGAVHFAYGSGFPQYVDAEDVASGIATNNPSHTNTVWLETAGPLSQIRAQNFEGRIFMEILGDVVGSDGEDDIREHLGFELLNVVKYAAPNDATVELGEALQPLSGDNTLLPIPTDQAGSLDFVYQHQVEGVEIPTLYSKRETENINDLLVYWLTEGVEGIRWPAEYTRYTATWPADVSHYSHYVRPVVESETDAEATAIQLTAQDIPVIEYQDPLDQPRATLTGDYRFYTYLDAAYPAHRTLLRYTAGNNVFFERVFSWLDAGLLSMEKVQTNSVVMSVVSEIEDGEPDANSVDFDIPGAEMTLHSEGYAFVGGFSGTIQVLDVSDPANPTVVRTIPAAEVPSIDALVHLTIAKGHLFATAYSPDAVTVFDLEALTNSAAANLDALVVTVTDDASTADTSVSPSVLTVNNLDGPRGTAVYDDYLYVYGDDDELVILGIADLASPDLQAEVTLEFDGVTQSDQRDMVIDGDVAFIAGAGADNVFMLNLDAPTNPVVVAAITDEVGGFANLNQPHRLLVSGDYLYIGAHDDDAVTIVTADTNLTWVAELRDGENGYLLDRPGRMGIDGGVLFIPGTLSDAVNVVDVSDPANPYLLELLLDGEDGVDLLDQPRSAEVYEGVAYISDNRSDAVTLFSYTVFTNYSHDVSGDFSGSLATELASYDSSLDAFVWEDEQVVPRVVYETIEVGARVLAPDGESGAGSDEDYLAGYINQAAGTSFSADAYINPLEEDVDLDDANLGAIIPVNARPGEEQLEVWWLRANSADTDAGFHKAYWPSALGRYTIVWPENPPEIVLASGDGSGPLDSLPAAGSIYVQNDETVVGYNPNEEHAIMSGGQAFALRDDLNVLADDPDTEDVNEYSSEPYVLLEYTEADGRPAMIAFKVLREKSEEGVSFTYDVEAGTVLQGPMPLPLLGAPIPADFVESAPSLNAEVGAALINEPAESVTLADVSTVLTKLRTEPSHGLIAYSGSSVLQDLNDRSNTRGIYVTEAPTAHEYSGFLFQLLEEGGINSSSPYPFPILLDQPARVRFSLAETLATDQTNFAAGDEVVLLNPDAKASFVLVVDKVSASYVDLDVPSDFRTRYTDQVGSVAPRTVDRYEFDSDLLGATHLLVPEDRGTDTFDGWRSGYWDLVTLPSVFEDDQDAREELYSGFTIQDRKGNVWVYRGPHEGEDEGTFAVRYHYPIIAGFWFPGLDAQPEVGSLTPYLRVPDSTEADGYAGAPDVLSDESDPQSSQALPIVYRPVWPADVPELHMAETLTLARRELPAIRGNSSLEIVYDQALVDTTNTEGSVVLHDPTRQKEYELGATNVIDNEEFILDELPASIATTTYNGDTFFPNLPPHLIERFFFDPNRGASGALVLGGTFVEETVGEDYVHLNTLSSSNIVTLKGLADAEDELKAEWDAAIDSLTTRLESFVEDPDVPGTYIVGDARDVTSTELSDIPDDDIAVDSYALTATGPGTGYVSLIAGNGLAFTPSDDPVSVLIVKVVDTLHQGEVKVIQGDNPLSEKLTLQQVVDLAAKTEDYEFDWRVAAPADGLAPSVFDLQGVTLLAGGSSWTHVVAPVDGDTADSLNAVVLGRTETVSLGSLIPVEQIDYTSAAANSLDTGYDLTTSSAHTLVAGNVVTLTDENGLTVDYLVTDVPSTTSVSIAEADGQTVDEDFTLSFSGEDAVTVGEGETDGRPRSYLQTEFNSAVSNTITDVWISLNMSADVGARLYINGEELVRAELNAIDSSVSNSVVTTPASVIEDDVLAFTYVASAEVLKAGTLSSDATTLTHEIVVEVFAADSVAAGDSVEFDVAVHAVEYVDLVDATTWLSGKIAVDGTRAVIGGTADVQALSDQYVIMRYRPLDSGHASFVDHDGDGSSDVWSEWTEPQLAEGWIKRVLAGINPFNQRTTDFFNNAIDTDASLLTQAGTRWEGDVALNSDTINDYGLIEIYETVLNRGRGLSIDSDINYGPANDALLLAAGYINDLYMFLGNEALSDALNPTIGIGTANGELGDVATSLFAFKGQTANLLEEELALLRGRDDFLPPGVGATPVYNRLFWNYTRGIDSGEVIYALNYNIQEEKGDELDGIVGAEDAAELYPQGHGDAYGHFLTGLKNYYSLIIDADFDWVPRTEGVLILNQTVQVDYTDERKFAAAAAAVARTGKQVFDLTWRQDYQSGDDVGWEHFGAEAVRENTERLTERHWGVDHWASRAGQGTFINWVAGNAMLPDIDDDPEHEGIQVIDRTTVPELAEIAEISRDLQVSMDSADAHLNPLGLSDRSMAFDVNPTTYSFWQGGDSSHFEQIYERAKAALNNAVVAFDDAKDVTRTMRGELDDLSALQSAVLNQEVAYTNALIEIYGTPYADDIGVGQTYATGYEGPDLINYNYIDIEELDFGDVLNPQASRDFVLSSNAIDATFYTDSDIDLPRDAELFTGADSTFEFTLGTHGFFGKPSDWTGRRESPGQIQLAIADIVKARNAAFGAMQEHEVLQYRVQREADMAMARLNLREYELVRERLIAALQTAIDGGEAIFQAQNQNLQHLRDTLDEVNRSTVESVPKNTIVGLSTAGGDWFANIRAVLNYSGSAQSVVIRNTQRFLLAIWLVEHLGNTAAINHITYDQLIPERLKHSQKEWLYPVDLAYRELQRSGTTVNAALQELADAQDRYSALVAKGNRLQTEREIYRKQIAAKVQGFRTRDAAFRLFRDEKLERYGALFDLAARYAFLAAQAFDYETGLLESDAGKDFIARIAGARALGVVENGEPQFGGSNSGDPGLSSTLAEMAADFQVLKGRLGLINPDVYSTTVSLRTENFRILPGSDGDTNWRDALEAGRMSNLLEDEDVVRHCLQIDTGSGLQVPGIVVEFSTQITEGDNLFGQPLAGGDHAFDISSFATKIFSVGIVMEGYNGMDNPSANAATTDGSSTADPTAVFLEPTALSATPYVYLIPVGLDAMRSPPLGDQSVVRTWSVDDVTIPLPFNIGASDFSTKRLYQSSDSLPEDLFSVRKHQAFRPVSDSSVFSENGQLLPSEYTNTRLIGRSVWNTKWKLVIPGRTLLNDPEQGLDILLDTLSDIKLHFTTYSYSGN